MELLARVSRRHPLSGGGYKLTLFFRSLALVLFLILATTQAALAGDKTYYAKLTATTSATGKGLVYASTSSDVSKAEYKDTSEVSGSTKTENDPLTFYAFAKANDGYIFQGWSDSANGNISSTDNPITVTVNASSSTESSPSTKTLYAQFVQLTEQTITFLACANGSYTATDGTTTIDSKSGSGKLTAKGSVTLSATPASGYKLLGWYETSDGGKTKTYFSRDAKAERVFTSSVSVGVEFVPTSTPIFIVKGNDTPYSDLNDANAAVGDSGTIVLVSDGTLPAGHYTISKGNTLLIPYDDDYTVKTTKAEVTQTWAAPKVFRTLTLASGADITVAGGAICVGGKQFSSSNQMSSGSGGPGSPVGAYGCIDMSEGGKITLENGSNLYAWGFITGQNMDEGNNTTGVGSIEAQNGANVYEDIIIADWHGGNATSGMDDKKKYFPFNQYFIPNIEVPLTIYYGATLNTVSDIAAGWGSNKNPYNVPITFIAKSGGLFNMQSSSSSAKLWYDATTDEQHFEFTGDNTIEGISANVGGYVTVDASKYVMPLTSNMDILIKSGTLKVPDDLALLPGSKVTVDEDVTATINEGANVYVYDLADWGLYAYGSYRKVYPFRPTKFKKYVQGDANTKAADVAKVTGLADAQIMVNGKLNVNGNLWTTKGGADVQSNGYGQIVFVASAPQDSSSTYQYIHGQASGAEIKVASSQLQNADGSYASTVGAAANTTYYYDPTAGKWATTEPAYPSFTYDAERQALSLANEVVVTAGKLKDAVASHTGENRPILSADLSNATGALDVAAMRAAIGANDENNVLLYAPSGTETTENNVIVDGKAARFTLTDKQPVSVPTAFTATSVAYSRVNTTNAGERQWGTICLPFEVSSNDEVQYYELSSVNDAGSLMTFTEVETVPANQPAVFAATSDLASLAIGGSDVLVAATADAPVQTGAFTLVGVQGAPASLAVSESSPFYYIARNQFWQPTKNAVTVRPQRAYFQAAGSGAKVFSIATEDHTATAIDGISGDGMAAPAVFYGADGQRRQTLGRGLNIIKMSDGSTRKVIIK